MSELVQFTLADGSHVLVEARVPGPAGPAAVSAPDGSAAVPAIAGSAAAPAPVPRTPYGDPYADTYADQPTLRTRWDRAGDAAPGAAGITAGLATVADRTFEAAVGSVVPAAEAVVEQLKHLAGGPDSIAIEFGIQLSAQAGAFIADVGGQANFKVTVTWKA